MSQGALAGRRGLVDALIVVGVALFVVGVALFEAGVALFEAGVALFEVKPYLGLLKVFPLSTMGLTEATRRRDRTRPNEAAQEVGVPQGEAPWCGAFELPPLRYPR